MLVRSKNKISSLFSSLPKNTPFLGNEPSAFLQKSLDRVLFLYIFQARFDRVACELVPQLLPLENSSKCNKTSFDSDSFLETQKTLLRLIRLSNNVCLSGLGLAVADFEYSYHKTYVTKESRTFVTADEFWDISLFSSL